ncbi:MAG: antirestriction protein ArdA [Muribaculaceae bacterium]|nr:antirestriction protein ArdA [Muribaculaceae bacterium]
MSEADFDRHIREECYNLEKMMGNLANFFDFEAFGRDLFNRDYSMGTNGNVFRRI